MSPRVTRAVLLDALGTLLALEPPGPRLRQELRRRGLAVSLGEAERAVAAEIAYYREHHLEGFDPDSLADLRGRCAGVLRDALPGGDRLAPGDALDALLASLRFRAYEDSAPALRELRSLGLRLVVVSNWDLSLHERLAESGLGELVDGAISSAEAGTEKPAPGPFQAALAVAGVRAAEALHVGDAPVEDVEGARSAGIEPVLLSREDGEGPPGVRRIRSLRELPGLAA